MAVAVRSGTLPLTPAPSWPALILEAPGGTSRWFPALEVVAPRRPEAEATAFTGAIESGAVGIMDAGGPRRRAILAVLGPGDLVAPGVLWVAGLQPQARFRFGPPRPPHGHEPGWQPEAVALVPSRIRVLPAVGLRQAIASGGPFALALVAALADQAARTERRLARILSEPVEARVMEILADLAHRFGQPARDGIRIRLPLTQEDLGSMAGAARESVSRAVRSLQGRGLVRRSGRSYVVGGPG